MAVVLLFPGEGVTEDSSTTSAPPATAAPTLGDGAGIEHEGPWVPAESVDSEVRRLAVAFDNRRVNIKNGGTVNLGDGLAIEIFADPYPPATLTVWLDLLLTQAGRPVPDASMGIAFDMLAMVHGPFWGEAENIGGGHYLFKLNYLMFGPWEQVITIRMGGLEVIDVPVVLSAHP